MQAPRPLPPRVRKEATPRPAPPERSPLPPSRPAETLQQGGHQVRPLCAGQQVVHHQLRSGGTPVSSAAQVLGPLHGRGGTDRGPLRFNSPAGLQEEAAAERDRGLRHHLSAYEFASYSFILLCLLFSLHSARGSAISDFSGAASRTAPSFSLSRTTPLLHILLYPKESHYHHVVKLSYAFTL